MERYFKVYTSDEYNRTLRQLHKEGCTWGSGRSLRSRTTGFSHPCALVVHEDNTVWIDEIRHCPDPSDRRLETVHLKMGDKVRLSSDCWEYRNHKDEIFEVVSPPKMIGSSPCVYLDHGNFGAFRCSCLVRI
jgi:hypothetical protein